MRYDRDQYTWKSDSSQLLRKKGMLVGSNLFHIGIILLFFGHFVGFIPNTKCNLNTQASAIIKSAAPVLNVAICCAQFAKVKW
jgi:nitrate reductase gamma subunit